ncbi:MAG: nucleotide exchange factor GrpE [Armatimonadota bacterium]|nr:nucleotide exchange factor GrpE [bacterium]MCS7309221.1 nucleotide exchange factor GrpE [Armatimonadota bacterium]MDW8103978.1 nucleotide exchange factor GrpE [Armatimonadota bacterium]MDW8290309.1 nucleotide exchange factor GrpE [Armatimonadota bacterium]
MRRKKPEPEEPHPETRPEENPAAEVEVPSEPTGEPEVAEVAALQARVRALEEENTLLKQQLADKQDSLLRTLADFDNFRRRTRQEMEEIRRIALEEFLRGLLRVMDNFERALQSAEESQSFEKLLEGVQLTYRQMQALLREAGVEPIEAVGKPFDPNFHEAVQRVESPEHPDETVLEEVERGYMIQSRVLRPSRVKVVKN